MINQETLPLITDVLVGPVGGVVFAGTIFAPALLFGGVITHACGLIGIRIRDTAIAAASVLWLLFTIWMTAFYAAPLFLADFSDHPPHGRLVMGALAVGSALLTITPIRIIRRFLLTGSVGPR